MNNFDFFNQISQKGYFQSKIEKINIIIEFGTLEFALLSKFQLKQTFFQQIFPKRLIWKSAPNFITIRTNIISENPKSLNLLRSKFGREKKAVPRCFTKVRVISTSMLIPTFEILFACLKTMCLFLH